MTDLESLEGRIQEAIQQGKFTAAELQHALAGKTKQIAMNTDEYVHDHPWTAVGIAAAVGLTAGVLLSKTSQGKAPSQPSRISSRDGRRDLFESTLLFVTSTLRAIEAFKALRGRY